MVCWNNQSSKKPLHQEWPGETALLFNHTYTYILILLPGLQTPCISISEGIWWNAWKATALDREHTPQTITFSIGALMGQSCFGSITRTHTVIGNLDSFKLQLLVFYYQPAVTKILLISVHLAEWTNNLPIPSLKSNLTDLTKRSTRSKNH